MLPTSSVVAPDGHAWQLSCVLELGVGHGASNFFVLANCTLYALIADIQRALFAFGARIALLHLPLARFADFAIASRTCLQRVDAVVWQPRRVRYCLDNDFITAALQAWRTLLAHGCIRVNNVLVVKTLATPLRVMGSVLRLISERTADQPELFEILSHSRSRTYPRSDNRGALSRAGVVRRAEGACCASGAKGTSGTV